MIKHFAWLGVAALAALFCAVKPAAAVPGNPLKPYVVLVLDTSGSMTDTTQGNPTGSGPPSCGGIDNKQNHARCAINRIVNSYGDMVFALGRFRMTPGGTYPNCTLSGAGASGGATCNTSSNMFELLTPLVDGGNDQAGIWTDGTANTCTNVGTDPELGANLPPNFLSAGNTPIEGSLNGVKSYWQGLQAPNFTLWPANSPGFDPIRNDPKKTVFLPKPGKPATCNPNPTTCDATAACSNATNCCCLEQCRPYITIMLTDGAETCTGTPANGAAALLQTVVDNRAYRIETKAIGIGIAAGNAQIEAIAHAGGAADGPGNEGFYVSDEQGLQLAMSQILDDAIRVESCNNLDDDCDVLIDEDFPNKGGACDNGALGVCRRTGVQVCRADGTGVQCNAAASPVPGTETCNMLDDDCDGKTDEGLTGCTCVPQGEQCNNMDDDCDGVVDDGITRACGVGTCTGIETCVAGVFQGCTAPPFNPVETCNGIDDNCDGVIDGLTKQCSNLVTPGGPATDNPAGNPASGCAMEGPSVCICHPGQETCPAGGGGVFGACIGEQGPIPEVCNNLDDDCDGIVDETTGGGDCSTNCGIGNTVCVNGVLTCNAMPATDDDTCDGNDDDCDGNIDEDYVSPGACGAGMVCNGLEQCINGVPTCIGEPILTESCNCTDDDCDTQVDEGSLCPGGATCTNCQCAFACSPGEFPCPAGKVCDNGFCIADACFGVNCPPVNGNLQVCQQTGNAAMCVDKCSQVTCPSGQVCVGAIGDCRPDDCTTFPDRCAANENCVAGECVSNPCQGVTCGEGQYCVAGACVSSCADVDCPDGQRCRLGVCETDPCGHPCPFGQVCNDSSATCVGDPCSVVQCQTGEFCNPNHGGNCEPDSCVGTACPDPTQTCLGGTCFDPQQFAPDAAGAAIVTTGGGGGCNTGGETGGMASGLLVALAALAQRTRRRKATRAHGGRS